MEKDPTQEITPDHVLDFSKEHLGRDLEPEEAEALTHLIEVNSPEEIFGYVVEFVSNFQDYQEEPGESDVSVDSFDDYLTKVCLHESLPNAVTALMEYYSMYEKPEELWHIFDEV